jgi:hypothetical protein
LPATRLSDDFVVSTSGFEVAFGPGGSPGHNFIGRFAAAADKQETAHSAAMPQARRAFIISTRIINPKQVSSINANYDKESPRKAYS